MKINELTGYKSNDLYTKAKEIFSSDVRDIPIETQLKTFESIMDYYGFEHLGTGSYGSAYINPKYPWVFKIFSHDPGYMTYIKYVKHNQNNPHVPKIRGGLIKISNNVYVVRIEKLTKLSDPNLAKIISFFQDLVVDGYTFDDIPQQKQDTLKPYKGLYKIISDIWNGDSFSKFELDLATPGNIMLRGNTPVILDPVV